MTALRDNPGVEAAKDTLRNAEELALAQYAGLLPSFSGSFSRNYQQIPGAADGVQPGTLGFGSFQARFYEAQLSPISYNLDVFGGTRRGIENRRALADYQRAYLEATDLTLTANVVSTAFAIASLERQITLEEGLVGYARRYLATLQVQFQSGAANGTDVALQQAQVANDEALIPPLRITLEQDRHLLAAYLGRTPDAADLPALDLATLALPPELPLSVPAALLDHRPDIAEAEAQLHAATADIGVAVAARLPQFSLAAAAGTAAIGPGDLFTGGGGLASLVYQMVQPIFEGGQLLHQQRAAEATARQQGGALAADGDRRVPERRRRAERDQERQRRARRRPRRRAGLAARARSGRDAVSSRQRRPAHRADRRDELRERLDRAHPGRSRPAFADSAALFVALGGGWWHRDDVPLAPPGVLPSLLPWSAS